MIDYKDAAQLRELMERVTEGPWVALARERGYNPGVSPIFSGDPDYPYEGGYYPPNDIDLMYIALSREALPYWIERATQAERAVERLADLLANEELCPQECENTAIGPDTAEDERVQICRECWLTRAMGGNSHVD